jgi:hemerythrin-like domain-containing protein
MLMTLLLTFYCLLAVIDIIIRGEQNAKKERLLNCKGYTHSFKSHLLQTNNHIYFMAFSTIYVTNPQLVNYFKHLIYFKHF